jgi:SAM-dependent methyltransferase
VGPDPGAADWCEAYGRAREREGRRFPDAVVAGLPDLPAAHALAGEWATRADTARRLAAYVRSRRPPPTIADLGCGNGWLANRLATETTGSVAGVDVAVAELDQARRVFGGRPNLAFVESDITTGSAAAGEADLVVLASVIQYVADLPALIGALRTALRRDAEIHIVDSPLYDSADVPAAAERTRRHYADVGVPEMAAHYHHHTWAELAPFPVDVIYSPRAWPARIERRVLRRPRSPFPWLRIGGGGRR